MEENKQTSPEPVQADKKHLLKDKRLWFITGGILLVVIAGIVAMLVLKKDDPAPEPLLTVDNAVTDEEKELIATGYTGIKEDVVSSSLFDCDARSDHEWYRSDKTLTVDYNNPDIMYVNVEYRGVYKSTDGGKTWTKKVKGIKVYGQKGNPTKGCYSEYPVIQMDPKDPKHLVIGLSSGGGGHLDATTPNSQTGGVYQSFDGAETWQLMINNKMNTYVTDVAIDPVDPKTVYYGTSSGPASWTGADQNKKYVTVGLIYKTTDSGKHWTELPTGLGDHTSVSSIMINPANTKEIVAPTFSAQRQSANGSGTGESTGKNTKVTQYHVLKSSDGGKTWQTSKLPEEVPVIVSYFSPNNFKNLFFGANGTSGQPTSYLSTDGATTFTKTKYLDVVIYDPHDPTGMHAVAYSTVGGTPTMPGLNLWESKDGGVTWKALGKLPTEIKNLNDPKIRPSKFVWHPTDPNTLFMAGAGGHVWKTTDLGKTWTTLLTYEQLEK